MTPKVGQLVIVWWRDASGSGAWSKDAQMDVVLNGTVGWITRKNRDKIVLAGSHGNSATPWGQVTAIPRESVTEVRPLRIGKKS